MEDFVRIKASQTAISNCIMRCDKVEYIFYTLDRKKEGK